MNPKELKEKKKQLHLTTADLAYEADLPVGTVSKVMTGETKNPSYQVIEKLSEVLIRKEQQLRLRVYLREMEKYFAEHPEMERDDDAFEDIFRKEHNLDDCPIPFAEPEEGSWDYTAYFQADNLARKRNKMTVEQFCDVTEGMAEARWWELLDGKIIYNEAPRLKHQMVLEELGYTVNDYIHKNHGKCRVFSSGVNTTFEEDELTLLIPDFIVRCTQGEFTEQGIVGSPDWVAEVTSPSTKKRDEGAKKEKYLQNGAREYWIIDPDKERVTVYCYELENDTTVYTFEDEIPVAVFEGKLKICFKDLLSDAY